MNITRDVDPAPRVVVAARGGPTRYRVGMAIYSPREPKPAKSRRSEPIGWLVKMMAAIWAGMFGFGFLMAVFDGGLPGGQACGRLALTSLLLCLLVAVSMRLRPDNKALRVLGAAVVGFPAGVLALGVMVPHNPWPPAAPVWWIFGCIFSVSFAWGTFKPD